MRLLILATLTSLAVAASPAVAAEENPPIPQDEQWQKKHVAESLAWNRRTLGQAYDKVGKKDPRWDKPAREALEAAARFFSNQVDPRTTVEDIYAPAKRAVDAGCDDPLILYLFARSSYQDNFPGPMEIERRYTAAAVALERSAYSPLRRTTALTKAAEVRASRKDLSPQERAEAVHFLDTALALLPKSLKTDEKTFNAEDLQFRLPMEVVETLRKLNGDYEAAFKHVDTVLAKTPALKAIRLQTQGHFLVRFAWEARGSGFANSVTEEGARKFQERLTEARKVLNQCWTLKPNDFRTANLMLMIEKGIGDERADMEKWFERAMKAYSLNKLACEQKLDWLDPKWHGSREEMLAFGRACRDSKNWRGGLTLRVADAHLRACLGLSNEEIRKYFGSKEVREDIQGVYEEYLKHYPDDVLERTRYAVYCFYCGRYAESDKQFKILGEDVVPTAQWPASWMKRVRALVAEQAAKEKPPK